MRKFSKSWSTANDKIPSIEKTEDFVYSLEINKGAPLNDPVAPHLLVFEQFIGSVGPLHSMDVVALRDGQRANDMEFHSFEHVRHAGIAHVKFRFYDNTNRVTEHNYILKVILRYLI